MLTRPRRVAEQEGNVRVRRHGQVKNCPRSLRRRPGEASRLSRTDFQPAAIDFRLSLGEIERPRKNASVSSPPLNNNPQPGSAIETCGRSLSAKRVLLVEDNFMVATAMQTMLASLGLEVVATVASVSEGLAAADRGGFDIALLDVSIIGGSSEAVARKVTSLGLPVAFVTGYGAAAVVADDLRKWPRLCKPFGADELRETLGEALGA